MLENIDNKATRGSISQIILKALSEGDKYGYEICKDIEKLSKGKLVLKQPSLYSSLRRMEEQKLISSYWKDSLLGGRRHYYSITEKGKQTYEENKVNWKDDEELLNSLPDSDVSNESSKSEADNELDEISNDLEEQADSKNNDIIENTIKSDKKSNMYILDQENLFNLARKKDEEIKKINVVDNNEENKSFFQFDFFEQNIKVVKKNNDVSKENIQVFTNKFSNLDNHSQNIEPENAAENNSVNNVNKINLSAIAEKEIKREDIFSTTTPNNIQNNKVSDNNISNNTNVSIFSYMKTDDEQNNNSQSDISMKSDINMKEEPIESNFEDNSPNLLNNVNDITWEKTEYGDAPLFDHDYKSAIGKLYNNSQLKDPYEQNKFQTFKEIFPSSTLKEKEKSEIRQTKIDAVIQSSSSSNIDCDDLMMLNNLYNLQGLNIKIHNNNESNRQNKIYRDKNKLSMVCSLIVALIGLVEFFISYIILDKNNLYLSNQSVIYICCSLVLFLISLFFIIKNFLDRYKLIIIKKNFTKSFVISLLLFISLVVITFAINVAVGMNDLGQVEFLSFWLIPCLLFTNILLFQGVFHLLLKTKLFYS